VTYSHAEKFYSINSLFGISIREVNSIYNDDNGFIWASSKNGILRLTNDDCKVYQLPFESPSVMTAKFVKYSGNLIVYTNNGQIFKYDEVSDDFYLTINISKRLNNKYLYIYDIEIDKSGKLWIASNFGLYTYSSGKLAFKNRSITKKYLFEWYDKTKLFLVKEDGIWILDTESSELKRIFKNKTINPLVVYSLYYDKNKKELWIGTLSNGFYLFSPIKNKITSFPSVNIPKQPVRSIISISDSVLLIGIDGQGIWKFDKNKGKILNIFKEDENDSYSLNGNGVYDLLIDNNKRVWIGTYTGGLSYFDQKMPLINQLVHRNNDSNSLVNNDVNSIIQDKSGKFWFATNNGLSCWNRKNNRWLNLYCNNKNNAQVFLSLCEDDKGRIWAGSYSSGVYVLDAETGREIMHYSRNVAGSAVKNDYIMDIYKDSQGDIWFGGVYGEFYCYDSKEDKIRTYNEESLNKFLEFKTDKMFLGCTHGLSILDKKTGIVKRLILGMSINDITIINNDLWIASSGGGLFRYNYKNGKILKITTKSGIPSNFVNSLEYSKGFLWVGTEKGLFRLNPDDNSVMTFSHIQPLSNASFNRGSNEITSDGQLVFGSNNGVIIFPPDLSNNPKSSSRIYLKDILISGRSVRTLHDFKIEKPVDSLESLTLRYFQKTITLELLPIGDTEGTKFSWMLEGFDKNWTEPTANRIITYTNIPKGKHELKIRLYDCSMSKVISQRTLKIKMIPPFWGTLWFWLILLSFLAILVYLILNNYIKTLKQKHIEDKVKFFVNTAHDIRTSLTLIKAPVEELNKEINLSGSGKYYLNLATRQVKRLSSMVNQLMDFQKVDIGKDRIDLAMVDLVSLIGNRKSMFDTYAAMKNIGLNYTHDTDSFYTAIDEPKFDKIFDNLISNAIKYSHRDSQITVDLKCDNKKWILSVKDNGIGINANAKNKLFSEFYRGENAVNSKVVGSGIGLLLVRNYVEMHDGTISYSSEENVGSTFIVTVPFKEVSNVTEVNSDQNFKDLDVINKSEISISDMENPITDSIKELKILIVEDNDELLDFMQKILSQYFVVITAVNGNDAWKIIKKQLPDLVISDIMMPEMDGFDLCKLVKQSFETSHIPIILLTALSDKSDELHGLGLGADDYLTKPFDMSILVQKIKSIIFNRNSIREKAFKLVNTDNEERVFLNENNDKFLKKIIEVSNNNISNSEFSKDDFAACMNVSSSLLYKKLKSLTGQSPNEFIKVIRLNKSLELLKTGNYSITEISELCGFSSVGYFSTVFKKHFGKSPTEI
jgi:signal transduction histidine kinase/DNA-binding response OmpR family regulator/ligand-binding sensor domain-containing protein